MAMNTPMHCPGFEQMKQLKSFECKCPLCGADVEVFSDEFDKPRKCGSCKAPIDFSQCTLNAGD
jgi:hypothetical protein